MKNQALKNLKFEKMPAQYKMYPGWDISCDFGKTIIQRWIQFEVGQQFVEIKIHEKFEYARFERKTRKNIEATLMEEKIFERKFFVLNMTSECKRLHHLLMDGMNRRDWEMKYVSQLFDRLTHPYHFVEEFFPRYAEKHAR